MSPELQAVFFAAAVICLLVATSPWPHPDHRIRWASFGSACAWAVFFYNAFDAARAS